MLSSLGFSRKTCQNTTDMKSAKEKRKSETSFQFKCPICNKVLPQEKQQGNFLEDPLPCADCFQKFRRRRSTQARVIGRRYSDLGTITEFSMPPALVASKSKLTDSDISLDEEENSIQTSEIQFYSDKEVKCSVCPKATYILTRNYADHLQNVHAAFGYDDEQTFYIFKNGSNREGFDTDGMYSPDYFKYGGHTFLSQGCNRNGLLHGWITLCSSKEEARNYEATVVIYVPESKLPNLQWRIPVQSVEEKKPDFTCSYSVRWIHLIPYLQKNVRLHTGDVYKYAWSTRVSIQNIPS